MALAVQQTQPQEPIADWTSMISEEEWRVYRPVILAAEERKLVFAIGGGPAQSEYSKRQRWTKDLDFFLKPTDVPAMKAIMEEQGIEDYFEHEEYDRSWIYRGIKDEVILDIIWTMPNHRMVVDDLWLTRGLQVQINDLRLRLLSPEELLWSKIYVMQRDRTDWPDLLNLIHTCAEELDWKHLCNRLGEDVLLLGGLLSVYKWMCPGGARRLPEWLWDEIRAADRDQQETGCVKERQFLLDTRDWFGPNI